LKRWNVAIIIPSSSEWQLPNSNHQEEESERFAQFQPEPSIGTIIGIIIVAQSSATPIHRYHNNANNSGET